MIGFGAFTPQGWRMDLVHVPDVIEKYRTMRRVALATEEAGFDSVWLYDHFHTVPEPAQETTFEAWTSAAALAEATNRIRIGHMVGCNAYRNPTLLAKQSSCVDVISEGRLEFGIGAGWYQHEFLAYGYAFPEPKVRIGMLDEAVSIIKAMWTEELARFEGKYYSMGSGHATTPSPRAVEGAINMPKPLQNPYPPIWIGGGGEQLTLRVVAKHADYSNFGGSVDDFRHKSEVLARHCEKVGRDFATITRSSNFELLVGESEAAVARKVEKVRPGMPLERYRRRTPAGTPAQIVDFLGTYIEAGCGYVICNFPDSTDEDSMRLFAAEVIPALRDASPAPEA